MRVMVRPLMFVLAFSAMLILNNVRAQNTGAGSPTIAAKTPVFAGACKACPWGVLAIVTADALKFYGYDTKVCWMCATSLGPREIADKTKPVRLEMSNAVSDIPASFMEPSPDLVPDFGATSESNLISAWNGTGDYAKDHKQRHNYRVIAVVRTTTYILAAASKKSGITNLSQIKDRKQPTFIERGNDADLIFDYYGIKTEELKAKGGGVVQAVIGGTREHRATADVFIGTGLMANTPEQGWWNEASQLNDLVFLDLDEPLVTKLAQEPGYVRATVPIGLLRGLDHRIATVMRPNHFIYTRDDAPDDFAYTVAKALDEHRQLFQYQVEPWYYDPQSVADSKVVPIHPGAMKYYRERGYVK
jgi:TRAP transporter TAXI family solute receptor